MPKSLLIHPDEVRRSSVLKSRDIPVNQYKSDPKKEARKFGKATLRRIYRDMIYVREFETMLDAIKTQGVYEGIAYDYQGPAHLSIGQEATAVGQSVSLDATDFIFGSHRSHGEVLAKCFSAIEFLDESDIQAILETYLDGKPLRVVERGHRGSLKELAIKFVLYGAMAEIFGRETGFNKGLGGAMHMFFAPFGSLPNNAIVGGSAAIAVGAALFKRINRNPGIVIANIGDAASGCGCTWEAMMLAAMDQYRTLWDAGIGGAPPLLFNFMNNFYGMGGQTAGETMGFGIVARMGAGVNPEALHAERIDGYNPLAVADAVARVKKILIAGRGPALLDTVTYRISGHSPSDASSYREKDEIELWKSQDCIARYAQYLQENKHMSASGQETLRAQARQKIMQMLQLAVSTETSPYLAVGSIGAMMFSNQRRERLAGRTAEVLISKKANPRVESLNKKSRFSLDESGKPISKAKVFSYRDALFEAMLHRFYEDPTMIAYGEENRDWGGAFAVYRGLTECLPYQRLFNASISEAAIIGSAVGYALSGGRVVAELMYCDFMGRAGDEIFNQMAKWQAMSGGTLEMPLVLRVSVGSKYGAQHSQDWTSLVAHIPGLKVFYPATPYDAKGMLNLALHGTDPVVFFESQRLYDIGEQFEPGGVPQGYYEIPEGDPAVRRVGSDLTIVTIGATLYTALAAADRLQSQYGLSSEVIDTRFINPLNYSPIVESTQKTGRVLLASDACERGSFLHTMAANLSQLAFDDLDGPIVVLGARNWITPPANMESSFFPQAEWIIDAIHERLLPLPGHQVTTAQATEQILKRNIQGI